MRKLDRATTRSFPEFTNSSSLYRTAFAALVAMSMAPSAANALPTDPQVESGVISIQQPTAKDLVINQGSDRAVINWRNFDILNGESTRFNQPGASSVALNRVWDGNPTQIFGMLSANGKVIIVNPSGVFFGPTSKVDVGGLVASTADIRTADFNAGKLNFSVAGKADASIINKGSITAADGGLVALIAPGVKNDGVIQANMGTVALAAGQTATIDFYGDNLYSFAVGSATEVAPKDENGAALAAAVENNGIINAQGGKVLLTAKTAKDVVTHAVNNTGIIEASSAYADGGDIVLDGGEGNVNVSGTVKANGTKGGNITATGKNIAVQGATIEAKGATKGGNVKIGGDYQGGGTLAHADTVYVDADSSIDASATDNGDGGIVVLWSDLFTQFNGLIKAEAGVNGGDGGLVETSSKGELGVDGAVSAIARLGKAGLWLLDPRNITISNGNNSNTNIPTSGGSANQVPPGGTVTASGNSAVVKVSSLTNALDLGTDVSVNTGGTGPGLGNQEGNIQVINDIVWNGPGSLTLNAFNDINLSTVSSIVTLFTNSGVNITNTGTGGFIANAGNNINLGGNLSGTTISMTSGTVDFNAGRSITFNTDSKINSSAGSLIDLTSGLSNSGSITFGSGQINSTGVINVTNNNGGINLGTGQINGGAGNVSLSASTNVDMGGNSKITATTGDISVIGGTDVNVGTILGGDNPVTISTTDGDIRLRATSGNLNVGSGGSGNVALTTTNGDIKLQAGNDIILDAGNLLLGTDSDVTVGNSPGTFSANATRDVRIGGLVGGTTAITMGTIDIDAGGKATFQGAGALTAGNGGFDIDAGGNIDINKALAVTGTGTFSASATGATSNLTVLNGTVTTASGNIDLTAGQDVVVGNFLLGLAPSSVSSTTGNINIDAKRDVTVSSGLTGVGFVGTGGDVDVKAGGNLSLNSNLGGIGSIKGKNVKLDIEKNATLTAASTIESTGGDLTADVNGDLTLDVASSLKSSNDITILNSDAITLKNVSSITAGRDLTIDNTNKSFSSDVAGIVSAGRNIVIHVANALGFKALSTVTTLGGDIALESDTTDITVDGSFITASGKINIKTPAKVTINGASLISAGNGILIDNGDDFFSQNADTLNTLLGTIKLNQAEGGSIQNAIDAIGLAILGSEVHLLNGSWTENVNINLSNFTLSGSGKGLSIINASGPGAVINAANQLLVTVKDLTVDAKDIANGITFDTVAGAFVDNVEVKDYTIGIGLNAVTGFSITNNDLTRANGGPATGISLTNGTTLGLVDGNNITHTLSSGFGIDADDVSLVDISNNVIDNVAAGIDVSNSDTVALLTNEVTKVGNFGIMLNDNTNLVVVGNTLTSYQQGIGTGILIGNNNSFLLPTSLNTINDFATGIDVHSNNVLLTLNTLNNTGNGIYFDTVTGGTSLINFINGGGTGITAIDSDGTTLTGNIITDAARGVYSSGGDDLIANLNVITGVETDGIAVNTGNNANINTNIVTAGGAQPGAGISFTGMTNSNIGDGTVLGGNIVTGFNQGIAVIDSDGISVDTNGLFDNTTGIFVDPTVNTSVNANIVVGGVDGIHMLSADGNSITNNILSLQSNDGIIVDDSDGTQVTGNSVLLVGRDGISVKNGSDNTFISNNTVGASRDAVHIRNSEDTDIHTNVALIGGRDGINARNADGLDILDNDIVGGLGRDGVHIRNTNGFNIEGNGIGGLRDGINIRNAANFQVHDNDGIIGGRRGISITNAGLFDITNNPIITGGTEDGIRIRNAGLFSITGNDAVISLLGGDGINIRNAGLFDITGNGVGAILGDGIDITNAGLFGIFGNDILAGNNGISLTNTFGAGIIGNDIILAGDDGIALDNANFTVIADNTVLAVGDGINVKDSDNTLIALNQIAGGHDGIHIETSFGNTIVGNLIGAGHDGIYLKDSDPLIAGNLILAIHDGIHAEGTDDIAALGNLILAGHDGIFSSGGNNLLAAGNLIGAGRDGIHLENQTGLKLIAGNLIGAIRDGVHVKDTDGAIIAGNGILAGRDGVHLDDADFSLVVGNGILAFRDGVNTTDSSAVLIAGNGIAALRDGVHTDGGSFVGVVNNDILAGRDGVNTNDTDGLLVASNDIFAFRDGIHLADSDFALVADNDVIAVRDGVHLDGGNVTGVLGNDIIAGRDGVHAKDTLGLLVSLNRILALRDGIHLDNADLTAAALNLIGAGRDGVHAENTDGLLIALNAILAGRDGVHVEDGSFTAVALNLIAALRDGVHVENTDGTLVALNAIAAGRDGVHIGDSNFTLTALNAIIAGRDGIHLHDTTNSAILANGIFLTGRDGIHATNSDNSIIAFNTVDNAGRDGIHIRDSQFNLLFDNNVDDSGRDGINITDSNDFALINNTITDSGRDGVNIDPSFNMILIGNLADNNGRDGFRIDDTDNVFMANNTATNNVNGIHVLNGSNGVTLNGNHLNNNTGTGFLGENVSGLALNGNDFAGNPIGARIVGTNGATFTGDIFTGNSLGINLDNSDNTYILDVTINAPAGGNGLKIENGSGGTLAEGLKINGGDVAVLIDGAGSDMQFVGNTSEFTGMNWYFILQNNAMVGDTLDASQQIFDGTRASDFTLAQLIAAEAKTIDVEDGIFTIGNVFYKAFPTASIDADEFQRNRKGLYRKGLFSYAGRTVASNIEEKSFSFDGKKLDLSLLTAGQGGTLTPTSSTVNIADRFAALAPAAGGTPEQLASLAPGAGGNTAGLIGGANAGGCGNNFLGGGFAPGFTCQ